MQVDKPDGMTAEGSRLWDRIFDNTDPKYHEQIYQGLLEYNPQRTNWEPLKRWLDAAGTDNPLEAANSFHLWQKEFVPRGKKQQIGRSETGQRLYNQTIILESNGNQVTGGLDMFHTLYTSFPPSDELSELEFILKKEQETPEKSQNKKRSASGDVEKGWARTIDEVYSTGDLDRIQSPHERKIVEHLQGLDEKTMEIYRNLDPIMAEAAKFREAAKDIDILAAEQPGTTLNWISRMKSQGRHVPDDVKEFADILKDDLKGLPKDRVERMWLRVKEYELNNRKVSLDAALGGFYDDIEYITQNKDDPILKDVIDKQGFPELSRVWDQIKGLSKSEGITLFDVQRMLDTNVGSFRSALNKEYFSRLVDEDEFKDGLEFLGSLYEFPSVKKSRYDLVFNNSDKKNIKEVIETRMFSDDLEPLFEGRHHQLFRQRMDGFIAAYRKAKFLDDRLKGTDEDAPEGEVYDKIKHELSFIRKQGYRPQESFPSDLSLNDFVDRATDQWVYTFGFWEKPNKELTNGEIMTRAAELGLWNEKIYDGLKKIGVGEDRNFIEYIESLKPNNPVIRELSENPFIRFDTVERDQTNRYISAEKHAVNEEYRRIGEAIRNRLASSDIDKELLDKAAKLRKEYSKVLKADTDGRITYSLDSYRDPEGTTKRIHMMSYVKPESIDQVADHVRSLKADEEAFAKARYMTTFSAGELLKSVGMDKAEQWKEMKEARPENTYMDQDTIERIDDIYSRMQKRYSDLYSKDVISTDGGVRKNLEDDSDLPAQFRVKLLNTGLEDAGKLRHYVTGGIRYDKARKEWLDKFPRFPMTKGEIGVLSRNISLYNSEYNRNILIQVQTV